MSALAEGRLQDIAVHFASGWRSMVTNHLGISLHSDAPCKSKAPSATPVVKCSAGPFECECECELGTMLDHEAGIYSRLANRALTRRENKD
ncbi:hypothetical protein D9611_014046 [Ephemerocybe angulata]|uniref:Uncharacterized protein n=1 Tax=Ephemerocybe angulata TaxID=980116 RepID=A0A8H5ERJ0_9AGAR|nr:hypothetical protein D9611_014046 [Tulosesus angulatus]